MTVITIGLLDLKSGLGPFAMYRSGAVIGFDPRAPVPGRRGDNQLRAASACAVGQ